MRPANSSRNALAEFDKPASTNIQSRSLEKCNLPGETLRQANIPVLSVHDSFIVRESQKDLLEQTMNREMGEMCSKLRESNTK